MSIVAGAISRTGTELPIWLRDALVSNLSRQKTDVPEVLSGPGWLLAKIDVGAFSCPGAFTDNAGNALMIAGEPLLSGSAYESFRNREDEGRALLHDLATGSTSSLRASTGAFCGAHYASRERSLTLIADKLGLRPLYYLLTPEFAAFTSALRIFEASGLTAGEIDLRGAHETCSFGFPLGTRTCYNAIRTIGPGELVRVAGTSEDHIRYFRWDRLPRTDGDESRLIGALAGSFDRAVERRLRTDRTSLSFLSGGLDSRAIVAALRSRSVKVLSVNFAPAGTQDRVFAGLASAALNTMHHQLDAPRSTAQDAYRQEFLDKWIASIDSPTPKPERPHCIWSGDGGSVGLGHIYLDQRAIDQFDKGNSEDGIRAFVRYNRIDGASNNAMSRSLRELSSDWHLGGIRDEIARLDGRRDGRALHLFLMLNDQRRHMAEHYENIDRFRFEFLMPFYDSDFLEVIVRAPARPFLRHSLYHKWLMRIYPEATSVPWQTYPNHEPCPVPCAQQLRYQFADYYAPSEARKIVQKLALGALPGLLTRRFPRHLVDRLAYGSAIITCLLGLDSYAHIVRVGDTFLSHWRRARGPGPHGFAAPAAKVDR